MGRLGSAIRMVFFIPPVWIALAVMVAAILINGWEPGIDIARYAAMRLFP